MGAFGLRYYSELTDSWTELATPSSASGVFQSVGVSQDGALVFVGGSFSSLTPQGSATPINATNLAMYNTNTKSACVRIVFCLLPHLLALFLFLSFSPFLLSFYPPPPLALV